MRLMNKYLLFATKQQNKIIMLKISMASLAPVTSHVWLFKAIIKFATVLYGMWNTFGFYHNKNVKFRYSGINLFSDSLY